MIDYLTSALATLLVVADPLLLCALFLAVTHGMNDKERREVALRGTIIAFCILVAAGLGGAKLLQLLGISLSAFRIAGGLLLLSSAAEMVFDRRSQRLQATADTAVSVDHVKNIAAFPLAIPLLAGAWRHHGDDPSGGARRRQNRLSDGAVWHRSTCHAVMLPVIFNCGADIKIPRHYRQGCDHPVVWYHPCRSFRTIHD